MGTYDDKGLEFYGQYSYDIQNGEDDLIPVTWNLKSVEQCPGLEIWQHQENQYAIYFVSLYHGIILLKKYEGVDFINLPQKIVSDLTEGHLGHPAIQRILTKVAKIKGRKKVCTVLKDAYSTVDSWIGAMKLVECLTRNRVLIERGADVHVQIVDIVLEEVYSGR